MMSAAIVVTLSHLQAMLFFAVIISVSFGTLGRRKTADRVKYVLWTLFLFILIGVGIGWVMYPFSR
jgi:NhaP-type Na+/H+ or K+/H+ antiporter